MEVLTAINSRLSRWAMYIACVCLCGLVIDVDYGVVMRYVFHNPPQFVEQVALLMVISVAMFGASAGVRDAGHIGMETLVSLLPQKIQNVAGFVVGLLTITFAGILLYGSLFMAVSLKDSMIPTLGIPESIRYVPPTLAGILIISFSIEHLIAMCTNRKVIPSWH